jgi:hypothetical protein
VQWWREKLISNLNVPLILLLLKNVLRFFAYNVSFTHSERIDEQKKAEKIKNVTFISDILRFICDRPLLEQKQRFPDSSFIASGSPEGHNASDARISSGSSWCAPDPVSNDKHYLQVDLRPVYTCNFCCDFGCDFLLLMDVNE